MVIHHPSVDSTTDGCGAVADLALPELKEQDAGSWFSCAFAGGPFSALAEVFEAVDRHLSLTLRLKVRDSAPAGLEEGVTV